MRARVCLSMCIDIRMKDGNYLHFSHKTTLILTRSLLCMHTNNCYYCVHMIKFEPFLRNVYFCVGRTIFLFTVEAWPLHLQCTLKKSKEQLSL